MISGSFASSSNRSAAYSISITRAQWFASVWWTGFPPSQRGHVLIVGRLRQWSRHPLRRIQPGQWSHAIDAAFPNASVVWSILDGRKAQPLANRIHHLREGGGDDGGESVAKLERLSSDSDNDGLGAVAV